MSSMDYRLQHICDQIDGAIQRTADLRSTATSLPRGVDQRFVTDDEWDLASLHDIDPYGLLRQPDDVDLEALYRDLKGTQRDLP